MTSLAPIDHTELGQLLTFLADWLDQDPDLDRSLERFVGIPNGYTTNELQADLRRFTFLLGHDDGHALFGDQP